MNNKIVQSLWVSQELGPLQKICIKSYLAIGHEFHLYTYQRIKNMPKGVVIKDANTIIPKNKIFLDLKNSYATFSDWFRIELLHTMGGWWVDSDTICLRYFDFKSEYVFATEVESKNLTSQCCNAVLKMPKNSLLGKNILESISKKLENGETKNINWTEIGAGLLQEEINNMQLSGYLKSPEVFCPVNFFNFKHLLLIENLEFDERTYAVHLWNKMWDWNNLSTETEGRKNSFLERMKTKFLE